MLFIIFSSFTAIGQIKVNVKVTNKKTNLPIADVSVVEKGSAAVTASTVTGTFSLTVKSAKSILVISYVGYITKEAPINGKTTIEVFLDEDIKEMEDVIVIGYEKIDRRKSNAAVGLVKGKDFENTPYAKFDAMLQGLVAGLTVLSVTEEPNTNNIVNIRGSTSVDPNSVTAPLYVIDGIFFDLNDVQATYGNNYQLSVINPNDIEYIDVLKNAPASTIYEVRASNGVIIIKNKRSAKGKPQLRGSSYYGISVKPAMKPMIVGAAERRMEMDNFL
jgi:TonB-dependent SusC/RagA subfamily outer membrane receptor